MGAKNFCLVRLQAAFLAAAAVFVGFAGFQLLIGVLRI